jgi:hypothetical protein
MFPSRLVDVAFFFLLDGPFPPSLLVLSYHFALVVLYPFRSTYPSVLAMICRLIRHRCALDLDYTSPFSLPPLPEAPLFVWLTLHLIETPLFGLSSYLLMSVI